MRRTRTEMTRRAPHKRHPEAGDRTAARTRSHTYVPLRRMRTHATMATARTTTPA